MTTWIRLQWILWCVLALGLIAGTVLMKISSATQYYPLTLKPGEVVRVSAFRLFADTLRLSLQFDRPQDAERPELGEFSNRDGGNALAFDNPGAAIKVHVSGTYPTAVYEALPKSSHTSENIWRDLMPFVDDGNAAKVPWPPQVADYASLKRGSNSLDVTVLDVGQPLFGEKVSLIVEPPLGFKSTTRAYDFLWPFFFWPVIC